jgi:hypothetical protein
MLKVPPFIYRTGCANLVIKNWPMSELANNIPETGEMAREHGNETSYLSVVEKLYWPITREAAIGGRELAKQTGVTGNGI